MKSDPPLQFVCIFLPSALTAALVNSDSKACFARETLSTTFCIAGN